MCKILIETTTCSITPYFMHSTSSFSKASPTNRPKFSARTDVAGRLERIAALKKRLGISTSAKKPSASVLSSSNKSSFFSDQTGIQSREPQELL